MNDRFSNACRSGTAQVVLAIGSAAVCPAAGAAEPVHETPASMVGAFHSAFGEHHARAVHAKGIILEGTFTPAPEARTIARAALFSEGPMPVTVRFSDFTGLPDIPDTIPEANPRGLAVKFRMSGGRETDIVTHSFNGFPVATVDEFAVFLRAVGASGPEAPKPIADRNVPRLPSDRQGVPDHPEAAARELRHGRLLRRQFLRDARRIGQRSDSCDCDSCRPGASNTWTPRPLPAKARTICERRSLRASRRRRRSSSGTRRSLKAAMPSRTRRSPGRRRGRSSTLAPSASRRSSCSRTPTRTCCFCRPPERWHRDSGSDADDAAGRLPDLFRAATVARDGDRRGLAWTWNLASLQRRSSSGAVEVRRHDRIEVAACESRELWTKWWTSGGMSRFD